MYMCMHTIHAPLKVSPVSVVTVAQQDPFMLFYELDEGSLHVGTPQPCT